MTATQVAVWHAVCSYDDLLPERGVCALINDVPVALFRTFDGELHAVSNIDPFSGASVLSRGIVGTRHGVAMVASPLFKQGFDLVTGQCLDDEDISIPVYAVRRAGTEVEISLRCTA